MTKALRDVLFFFFYNDSFIAKGHSLQAICQCGINELAWNFGHEWLKGDGDRSLSTWHDMLTVAAPCGCRVSFNENTTNLRRSISEYIRIFPFTFLEKLDTHTTLCREQIGARHKFQVLSDYGRSRACSTIERRLRNRPKQKSRR